MAQKWFVISLLALSACGPHGHPVAPGAGRTEWPEYGNDVGGNRYSALSDIDPGNVKDLEVAWIYHTGDQKDASGSWHGRKLRPEVTFEATPLLIDGTLYVVTPFNRVIALEPETGVEKWAYDPKIDLDPYYGDGFTCRGLSSWLDLARQAGEPCRRRIYVATQDARLIAVDAANGKPCADFGTGGEVALTDGVSIVRKGEYHVTSPPAILGDNVVVGSAIDDNQRVDMPSGAVRAYDARTGKLRWAWDPIPRDPKDPARATWQNGADTTGAANAWAPLSADPERDLVFVPTGSASPDFYGGERKGENRYANSVVALRGSTGKVVWHFQVVHHDLWDYDVPAQPSLIDVEKDGKRIPAVAQATKMGLLFILNRETGEPVVPVEERPVPQGGVEGEWLSPTQPFPVAPPPLVPQRMKVEDAWGLTPLGGRDCRDQVSKLRSEGIYTPPSLQGTLNLPGNAGGTNWGGVSYDQKRGLILVNQSNLAFEVHLVKREQAASIPSRKEMEQAPQKGTPYIMRRRSLLSSWGLPCNPPPWGTLAAVEAATGRLRWQVTLGTIRDLSPIPLPIKMGTPNLGGPLTTASGITFIAAAMDNYLRAFDTETGRELWKGRLPAGAQATPMTYRARDGGRQFVVICAGGHGKAHTTPGDAVVAFALR